MAVFNYKVKRVVCCGFVERVVRIMGVNGFRNQGILWVATTYSRCTRHRLTGQIPYRVVQ